MQKINKNEIEKQIYGEHGLYRRVIDKIREYKRMNKSRELITLTGKKQQYIDTFIRQFENPEKYDYRPKFDTILSIAEKLGVE